MHNPTIRRTAFIIYYFKKAKWRQRLIATTEEQDVLEESSKMVGAK